MMNKLISAYAKAVFAVAALLFGAAIQAQLTPASSDGPPSSIIHVIRGTVIRQTHGCEVDGLCSVIVRTEHGDESVVWNEGETLPDTTCPRIVTAEAEAAQLKPGQSVEMHVRISRGKYMLCGEGASIVPKTGRNQSRDEILTHLA